MKWQYVIVCLLLITCVGSVGAVRENFQSWGSTVIGGSSSTFIENFNTTAGLVGMRVPQWNYVINIDPTVFDYAAFDSYGGGCGYVSINLLDSGGNIISGTGWDPGAVGRIETKIIGGTPTTFINGVQYGTGSIVSVNPSYFKPSLMYGCGSGGSQLDNFVIGGTDHHVVGALPSNWTIQRDLINPSATGVYAWNNATQTWVLKNSHYFYIDADTDSQDAIYTENFDIVNFNTGITINTTVINSTIPRHNLQYNVNNFISQAEVAQGSAGIDGMYYAQFRGYPDSRSYFWIISSGASVSWNKNTYAQGDSATITYAISNSYWVPATYTYRVDVIDTTGTVKKTQTIASQTGTVSIADLDSTTYPAGAYYAEVIAHDTSDHTMAYAAMEVTDYIYLSGYVMNAETGAVVSNANVTVSQGTTTVSYISSSSGWGNTSSYWLTGSDITILTTLSGYSNDIQTITPLAAGSIEFNISLMPSPATSTGISVGGIVRQGDPTGATHPIPNPIPSATYHVMNGTEYTCTTNIAGYCRVNNLVNNTLYDVWSSKTGYANSTVEKKLAVGV